MQKRYLLPAIVLSLFAVGCGSEPSKTAEKKVDKPLSPLTGRQAFQQMYPMARNWAPDALPIKVQSVRLAEVKADPGKSGGWEAMFVSQGRSQARGYTWSAIEAEGNMHRGVFAGPQETWGGLRGQEQLIQVPAIKIDSDEAYQTAVKKSAEYIKKNPDKPVAFLLEYTKRFPNPAWRVIWGESVGTSDYSVFVDASTGEFLEKAH